MAEKKSRLQAVDKNNATGSSIQRTPTLLRLSATRDSVRRDTIMEAAGSSPTTAPRRLRLVIFPWLAFGHLLPYLELTDRLASRGHHVSFVSTPRNIARLPPLRLAAAPHVEMVALPLSRVDGLPDDAESTNDLPADKFELLWKAFDGLAAPFAEFLGAACADVRRRPDWVIVDSFHHWAAAAAADHKVPCAVLLPSAAILAALDRPETMPRYERERLSRYFRAPNASGMSNAERCALVAERCTLGVMRSCVEWEPEHFPAVAANFGKPVVPLGLLPPSPDGGRRAASGGGEDPAVLSWLDAQPPGSVLYVALGSEVPLRAEQARELAHGLDLAGTRFLWALRKPRGSSGLLPAGFLERTRGRGLVVTGWVPQMSILAHGAVGAFLTHCGRNSLVEGLLFGHPLVMLPMYGDQGPNARAMERRMVGLQVTRDHNDGSFHRDAVAEAVRAVMVEEDTRSVFVANARELHKMVADMDLQERYIDEFVQHLGAGSSEVTAAQGTAPTPP